MYQSMVMLQSDVSLAVGDKVRLLPYSEIKKNTKLYGFEEAEDVNYDEYMDMDLEIVEISTEKIREDLIVTSLRIKRTDYDVENIHSLPWFYYMLEAVEAKGRFLVELL